MRSVNDIAYTICGLDTLGNWSHEYFGGEGEEFVVCSILFLGHEHSSSILLIGFWCVNLNSCWF